MAKSTSKGSSSAAKNNTKTQTNPLPPADPIINDEETNSYEEELNKRIDLIQPEGGTLPDETKESENENSQGDQESDPGDGSEAKELLSDDVLGMLSAYVAAYPDNEIFHVTTDGQVFLDSGKNDAINHQKTLGGKVKSFTV